jgi:nicotinamide riboside kinase
MDKQLKIAFTGPESSGKTTMTELIAEVYSTSFIPEYAREFLKDKTTYTLADLDEIAKQQVELCKASKNTLVISDTEMAVMLIWSQEKFKEVSPIIQHLWESQDFDHLFLCAPDIPWEADKLRENPLDRERLFQLYEVVLENSKKPFTILKGTIEQRIIACKKQMELLLKK